MHLICFVVIYLLKPDLQKILLPLLLYGKLFQSRQDQSGTISLLQYPQIDEIADELSRVKQHDFWTK